MNSKVTARSVGAAALGGGVLLAAMTCVGLAVSATGATKADAEKAAKVPAALTAADIDVQYNPLHPGQADFVVADFKYALGPDADKAGTCPAGMTQLPSDLFAATPEGKRRDGETDNEYARRVRAATAPQPGAPNDCAFPEKVGPDPNFRTVGISHVAVDGIDLDGQASTAKGRASGGSCSHDDFRGANSERGIDNQFFRAVGCTRGFQTTGAKNGFGTEMLTGAWGIVISIKGMDNPLNDNDVEVGIHANADPIQLSPARTPLMHMTYAVDPSPRFQARTKGRIVNGVLITDPVNVRFHTTVNAMVLERPLEQARLRMTFGKDGSLEGILAGYANVDELFDFLVGMRTAKDTKGNPAPQGRRLQTAGGSSRSAGFTCNGMYHAFKQLADGHRDPVTGQCSTISMQYRVKAVPAYVVEPSSRNTNIAGNKLK